MTNWIRKKIEKKSAVDQLNQKRWINKKIVKKESKVDNC